VTLFVLTRGSLDLPMLVTTDSVIKTEKAPNGHTTIHIANGDQHVVRMWPSNLKQIEEEANTVEPKVDYALLVLPIMKMIPFDTPDDMMEFIGTMAWCLGKNIEGKQQWVN